jgi:hypothetical protein
VCRRTANHQERYRYLMGFTLEIATSDVPPIISVA